jgi:hypothetical protein
VEIQGEDSAPPAADEVELRWTLERREFLEAVRPSIGSRILGGARIVIVLIALWSVVLPTLVVAVLAIQDPHLVSLSALLSVLGSAFMWPQGAPLVVLTSLCAVFAMLVPWWVPEWRARRVWRRSPRLRAACEAVLQPTGITIRIVDSESRQQWSVFDAVSDVGLSYRLRVRDRRPAMYMVIPKRAMHGAEGPAELGELLRRWIYGSGAR